MAEYLRFIDRGPSASGKTRLFEVRNTSGLLLGNVKWHGPWRRYIYAPSFQYDFIYDAGCLREIAVFIDEQMEARKQ